MRQIVLDTETTGLEPSQGHRIIEIGCVELVDRRPTGNNYHQYINPERAIDDGAIDIHGLTNDFLVDKPLFADVAEDFSDYIHGAELIIHNAPFDVGFINHEFAGLKDDWGQLTDHCQITDTLAMARSLYPGQRNSLDALCKRYEIDNSHRQLHGALLDAEILVDVYLRMTGGQVTLSLSGDQTETASVQRSEQIVRLAADRSPLVVRQANADELRCHIEMLNRLEKLNCITSLWNRTDIGKL